MTVCVDCTAQIFDCRVGIAPLEKAVPVKGPVPFHVLQAEEESQAPAPEKEQGRQQRRPHGPAHSRWPVAAQEHHHALADGGARAIDKEIRPRAEALQISNHILVERDRAGD